MNDGGRYSIQSPILSNLPPARYTLSPPITPLLLVCLVIGLLGWGDGEAERRERALETARVWAGENTSIVVSEATELITSGVPAASLFSDIIANQIVNQLSWNFSEPENASGSAYKVRATISTRVSLTLPAVGSKTYRASLPFDLEVGTDASTVSKWSVGLDDAAVAEE